MANSNNTIDLTFPEGKSQTQHAVIWLHGLGATSSDFPPVVPELGLDANRPIRFIFPQAPNRPITINGGMSMPGWYDIKGMDIADKQDADGIAESQQTVEAIIQQLANDGIPSENVILAGFSQGGAVVYHTALRSNHKLAGLMTLSTYLPFAENVAAERSEINKSIPVFASHGTYDAVVPLSLGKASVDHLNTLNYKVLWRTYPMEHQVVLEQLRDIGEWINSVFAD